MVSMAERRSETRGASAGDTIAGEAASLEPVSEAVPMPISRETFERVALEDSDELWALVCCHLRAKPGMTANARRSRTQIEVTREKGLIRLSLLRTAGV